MTHSDIVLVTLAISLFRFISRKNVKEKINFLSFRLSHRSIKTKLLTLTNRNETLHVSFHSLTLEKVVRRANWCRITKGATFDRLVKNTNQKMNELHANESHRKERRAKKGKFQQLKLSKVRLATFYYHHQHTKTTCFRNLLVCTVCISHNTQNYKPNA